LSDWSWKNLASMVIQVKAGVEQNLSVGRLGELKQNRNEQAGRATANDLVGSVQGQAGKGQVGAGVISSDNELVLKNLKDHLTHAKKVGVAIRSTGNSLFAHAFLKEVLCECKAVLDDRAVSGIIKTCIAIKNENAQSARRKSKLKESKTR
jgi:translation initiation factor 3 subunit J